MGLDGSWFDTSAWYNTYIFVKHVVILKMANWKYHNITLQKCLPNVFV